MDFDFIASATSIEEMEAFVSLNEDLKEIYQEVLYDVRRNIVFSTNNNWSNYSKFEVQIREEEEFGFKYSFDALKKRLPEHLQELVKQEKILQFNRMKCIARANILLGVDYKTFKELEKYSSYGFKTTDQEALDFLILFEKIKNGEQLNFITKFIPDIIPRLNKIYEDNFNSQLTDITKKEVIDANTIISEFGLSEENLKEIEFFDAGFEFNMPIKSMGYGERYGDNTLEVWMSDSRDFLYESKSYIREDSINIFLSSTSKLQENWIVGYNKIHNLVGMGSHDIDSNTNEQKEFISGRKPCKTFVNFCSPDELIYKTGLIDDDNHPVFDPYNEIDDNKYENGQKILPDYLIFPYSSNPQSKFFKFQSERLKKAIKAARELGNNKVLIIDIDKVLHHQFILVEELKNEYLKTHNLEHLQDLLIKIHNNRKCPYSSNVFTDEYLFSILSDVIDFENTSALDLIDDIMLNMTNVSNKKYQSFISKLRKEYEENRENTLNDISDLVSHINREEDLLDLASKEEQNKITVLKETINNLNKKIIKTKKTKSLIQSKKLELDKIKKEMITSVKEQINNRLKEVNLPPLDFNSLAVSLTNARTSMLSSDLNMSSKEINNLVSLDTRVIDIQTIMSNSKNKTDTLENELSNSGKKM